MYRCCRTLGCPAPAAVRFERERPPCRRGAGAVASHAPQTASPCRPPAAPRPRPRSCPLPQRSQAASEAGGGGLPACLRVCCMAPANIASQRPLHVHSVSPRPCTASQASHLARAMRRQAYAHKCRQGGSGLRRATCVAACSGAVQGAHLARDQAVEPRKLAVRVAARRQVAVSLWLHVVVGAEHGGGVGACRGAKVNRGGREDSRAGRRIRHGAVGGAAAQPRLWHASLRTASPPAPSQPSSHPAAPPRLICSTRRTSPPARRGRTGGAGGMCTRRHKQGRRRRRQPEASTCALQRTCDRPRRPS